MRSNPSLVAFPSLRAGHLHHLANMVSAANCTATTACSVAWNTVSAHGTCGANILHLVQDEGYKVADACDFVAIRQPATAVDCAACAPTWSESACDRFNQHLATDVLGLGGGDLAELPGIASDTDNPTICCNACLQETNCTGFSVWNGNCYLKSPIGSPFFSADTVLFLSKQYPPAAPPDAPPDAPPSQAPAVLSSECADTAACQAAWSRHTNHGTCGANIIYAVGHLGLAVIEACVLVATTQASTAKDCAPCDPSWVGPSLPPPPQPPQPPPAAPPLVPLGEFLSSVGDALAGDAAGGDDAAGAIRDRANALSTILATRETVDRDLAQDVVTFLSSLLDQQAAAFGSDSGDARAGAGAAEGAAPTASAALQGAIRQLSRAAGAAAGTDGPPVVLTSPRINLTTQVRSPERISDAPVMCKTSRSDAVAKAELPSHVLQNLSRDAWDHARPVTVLLYSTDSKLHPIPLEGQGDLLMANQTAPRLRGSAGALQTSESLVSFSLLQGQRELRVTNTLSPIKVAVPYSRQYPVAPMLATAAALDDLAMVADSEGVVSRVECAWWDVADGRWSRAGCSTKLVGTEGGGSAIERNESGPNGPDGGGHVLCECNHLTDFVVFEIPLNASELLEDLQDSWAMNSFSDRAFECISNPDPVKIPAVWVINGIILLLALVSLLSAVIRDGREVENVAILLAGRARYRRGRVVLLAERMQRDANAHLAGVAPTDKGPRNSGHTSGRRSTGARISSLFGCSRLIGSRQNAHSIHIPVTRDSIPPPPPMARDGGTEMAHAAPGLSGVVRVDRHASIMASIPTATPTEPMRTPISGARAYLSNIAQHPSHARSSLPITPMRPSARKRAVTFREEPLPSPPASPAAPTPSDQRR